jgi:hypothetical protein
MDSAQSEDRLRHQRSLGNPLMSTETATNHVTEIVNQAQDIMRQQGASMRTALEMAGAQYGVQMVWAPGTWVPS